VRINQVVLPSSTCSCSSSLRPSTEFPLSSHPIDRLWTFRRCFLSCVDLAFLSWGVVLFIYFFWGDAISECRLFTFPSNSRQIGEVLVLCRYRRPNALLLRLLLNTLGSISENLVPLLRICCAFAVPLLRLVNDEKGLAARDASSLSFEWVLSQAYICSHAIEPSPSVYI
jgi:hypothetical protein